MSRCSAPVRCKCHCKRALALERLKVLLNVGEAVALDKGEKVAHRKEQREDNGSQKVQTPVHAQ